MPTRELITIPKQAANRAAESAQAEISIYKPFFLAGILTVLTAGCSLGAVAIFGIAARGTYTSASWTPYILAHANSQLYGWVGFFIMGFALQQHAPSLAKVQLFHRLAHASLGLMAIGIGLRFAAEPLASSNPHVWVPVGVLSAVLQFVAVALFFVNMQATRYRTGEGLPWQGRFVMVSLAWLLVVAAAEPFFFALAHQADPNKGILFVAEYYPPYREAQFLGFVSTMIFGVALTKMSSCFGAKPAHRDIALAGLLFWTVGIVARMAGWILYFEKGMLPGTNWLYVFGGLVLAASAVALALATRIFEKLSLANPSQKFIRTAFAWLLVVGVLLLFEPIHLKLAGLPFSHAYVGGLRHALTVGFISQMILGVGMHVVARMNDVPAALERPLWTAFVLVNLGNAARVFLEIASDYTLAAFKPMGFSGFIELLGLAIWAGYVINLMLSRQKEAVPA